jgi:hypothetical protein
MTKLPSVSSLLRSMRKPRKPQEPQVPAGPDAADMGTAYGLEMSLEGAGQYDDGVQRHDQSADDAYEAPRRPDRSKLEPSTQAPMNAPDASTAPGPATTGDRPARTQ